VFTEKAIKQATAYGILVFFFLWFFIAALSNVCDLLINASILPQTITFRSGNLSSVQEVLAVHGLSSLAIGLLTIVAFLELLIADLFAIALWGLVSGRKKERFWRALAFASAMLFWALMLLASEALVFYNFSSKFFILFILMLQSWQFVESTT